MANLNDLIAQREALDKQIDEFRRTERSKAVEQVRSLMSEFGLSVADLATRRTSAPAKAGKAGKSTGKVAAKYRNAATGDTWSGRGLQPRWLKAALASGKKLDDFAV